MGEGASTSALEAFMDSSADPLRQRRGAHGPGRPGGHSSLIGQYERYGLDAPISNMAAGRCWGTGFGRWAGPFALLSFCLTCISCHSQV